MKPELYALALMITLISSPTIHSQAGCLPAELAELAQKIGCSEVEGFFDRPGQIDPPYVYGYLPGPKENSAAFWCEKRVKDEKTFFLVIATERKQPECLSRVETIPFDFGYPGGLSICRDTNTTMEGFHSLNDPARKPPQTERLSNNAISSHYDGVEVLFYFYNGEWIVRIRH